jgi:hypothetical protein
MDAFHLLTFKSYERPWETVVMSSLEIVLAESNKSYKEAGHTGQLEQKVLKTTSQLIKIGHVGTHLSSPHEGSTEWGLQTMLARA